MKKELISSLILKYNEYGFLDQLHRKWYGRVHCLESSALTKPKPLSVRAVAGVFMMLCFGMIVGTVILLTEHFVFKYILPSLRMKPKDCFWKSPNLMFFSQVSYHKTFFNIFVVQASSNRFEPILIDKNCLFKLCLIQFYLFKSF
jgi:hypothetical protein